MRKLGINFSAYRGLTHEEYAKKIAELGFEATFTGVYETEAEQAEVADILARYGIAYETIHAPFRKYTNHLWLDCEEGDRMLATLKTSIDRCKLVGAPVVVVHLSSGEQAPPVTDIGRARFTSLVEHAAKNGVTVAFENQRKLANLAWAFETFSAEDSVGFCWDCGHEACFTPGREYMPLFGKRVVCLHIHDNMGVYNGDCHMIPFDGKINFYRFAEHLRNSGFDGTLMLEVAHKKPANYYENHFYLNLTADEYLQRAANAVKKLRDMVDSEA